MSDAHSLVAHHFDDLEQQHYAGELGMWIFLATEVLFFGGLFTGYTVYRIRYEAAFAAASHHMDITIGTVNTAVLLTSSLCMALAVHSAQTGHRRSLVLSLGGTVLFGAVFLGFKFYEYYEKFHEGLMPLFGLPFLFEGPLREEAEIFYNLYFAMTGLHALHMIIGIVILLILLVAAWRGRLLGPRYMPVHITGLYWHFVDIVWVFLFPFLYLAGTR